jgi:transposase
MGIRSLVSRNTLANANEKRDWRIYADFSQILIQRAKVLYSNEKFALQLQQSIYAFDSTIIDLALSIFPWSKGYRHRGALKLHTLLNLKGAIPAFVKVTRATVNDFEALDDINIEPGGIYIMDRGFIDLSRLYIIHQSGAFFVTREKSRINWQRLYSHPVDKSTGLRCDQTIVFTGRYSAIDYPVKLRRIRFFDSKNNRYLTFWTNNFILSALTIAQLYQCRWQIELFFKWVKQHLRIKAFYGTSENAVKSQIFIAICVYVLVAVVKKCLGLEYHLYTVLQVLSVSAFERVPLKELFSNLDNNQQVMDYEKQLLFGF